MVAMMQTTGLDYYDIPDDELPSANFAARPTSDISDLGLLDIDGLWSFIYSASSSDSEDDFGNGPTPTALISKAPLMSQPVMPRTPPDTPVIKVSSPSRRQSLRQHIKRVSEVAAIVRNPSMRRKADTLPGTTSDYAPQVPRRAMSARLDKRDVAERHSRHLSSESDLKARSILGLDESVERPGQHSGSALEKFLLPSASFSRKQRVQETLERKKLSRLRMDLTATPDEIVDSPQSILGTPEELYAAPQPQPGRFRPTSAIHGRRGTSTPVSPRTPSALPQSNESLAGGKVEELHQTRIYLSGPIRLEQAEEKSANSFETDSGRRPSDLLEQVVVYFDGMGLGEAASEQCLDRYWLEAEADVGELEPLTPRTSRDGSRLSKFSFSSASSGASVVQDSPQKRQLIRLRRLLSPALPGLKGPEG